MPPSLEGAQAWLERADEHLNDLREFGYILSDRERERISASLQSQVQPGNSWYKFTPLPPDPGAPPRLSVLVGEVAQALRRVLDYLVYEIAWLDSGIEQNDTQFPFDDDLKRFWGRRLRNSRGVDDHSCYLVGVSDKHAAVLERYQPGNGVEWTPRLRTISNPDKHRHLTIARHATQVRVALASPADDGVLKTVSGLSWSIGLPDGNYMKLLIAIDVTFDDGSPVVETLQQLKAEVADVLQEFEPCFRGRCRH